MAKGGGDSASAVKAKPSDCLRVGTWNVEWAKPGLKKAGPIKRILTASKCDVLCVTEGGAGILPDCGHVIDGGTDWGYPIPKSSPGRRKVLLWSKRPWTPVFDRRQDELPGGRLVAGLTETPIGKVTVVGVCIPWRDAHVSSGRRDREPWQDHLAWLTGFEGLCYARSPCRTIVLGDFNQRIPKGRVVPKRVHRALGRAFRSLRCSTEGQFVGVPAPLVAADGAGLWKAGLLDPPDGKTGALIDHIAHSQDLIVHQPKPKPKGVWCVGIFPDRMDGTKLSDHKGVWVDLEKA